jgi:poly(3-hydroxybutyrate) depolymerase
MVRIDGYPRRFIVYVPPGRPDPDGLIDEIVAELDVDPTGVFVSGFSNGGAMTQRLAVELTERFAAATSVGSNVASFSSASPTPDPLIPVWQMIGEVDPKLLDGINAAEGPGTPPSPPLDAFPIDPAAFLAVSRTRGRVERAMHVYQLEYDPRTETDFGTHSVMRWATPQPGDDDGNVFLVSVLGGVPHHYPNGPGKPRKNPHAFSAAEMSWEFFQKHWDR